MFAACERLSPVERARNGRAGAKRRASVAIGRGETPGHRCAPGAADGVGTPPRNSPESGRGAETGGEEAGASRPVNQKRLFSSEPPAPLILEGVPQNSFARRKG